MGKQAIKGWTGEQTAQFREGEVSAMVKKKRPRIGKKPQIEKIK